ncbi:glycogen/starch synthase [Lutimonas saemankumensis]|uniref:glycogen synthase n=1 Tax=Lutimonas saemankumensis TaxID=483016 RepID=UPI001CD63611|nr:glycogen/starch synthase [Lutimonas saemankumensis]MCA0930844.1 glycogen/starch synthase [Lutimonas saemankumensis]
MEILHVSAECFPVAKVGGLADVLGALPKYQNKNGVDSKVIMPFYDNEFKDSNDFNSIFQAHLKLGKLHYDFEILTPVEPLDFPVFLVDIHGLFDRPKVYSYEDDVERFLAFQLAVLEWVLSLEEKPDIIHAHDHQTGFLAFLMSHGRAYKSLKEIPTVFTIHNAQYQGQFGYDKLRYFPEFDLKKMGIIDWDGSINPLATAIKCSWRVTTVSKGYLEELKSNANGLEKLISDESEKFSGILNGIDTELWNPELDSNLVKNYSIKATK